MLDFIGTMKGARDGTLTTLGGDSLTGIITFPSFHAAGAVILAWGWRGMRGLAWPGLILNLLMILSALIGGGHYLVDLVAGAAVAAASIRLAGAIQRRLAGAKAPV